MGKHPVRRLEHKDEQDTGVQEHDVQTMTHRCQVKVNPDRLAHTLGFLQEQLAGVVQINHLLGGQSSWSVHYQARQTSHF